MTESDSYPRTGVRSDTVETLGSAPTLDKETGDVEVVVSVPVESPPDRRRDAPEGATVNNLFFWGTWTQTSSSTAAFKNWNPGGVGTQDAQAPTSFLGTQTRVDSYQETKHVPTASESYFGIVTKVFPNQGNNKQPAQPLAQNLYQLDSSTPSGFRVVAWPT